LEARVIPYPGGSIIEFRRVSSGVWLRLTKSYTATFNPRHWCLTHPWVFTDYEEAEIFASNMTEAWLLNHLKTDRESYHALKESREAEMKMRRGERTQP